MVRWLVVLLLLWALPVRADEPPQPVDPGAGEGQAWRKLYDEGKVHYQLREYDQAITAFKEAYRQSRKPELLFNIAQAYRLAGDCASAARFYRTYLDAAQVADPAPVEARIQEMEACAATPVPVPAPAPPRPDRWRTVGWVVGGVGVATGVVGGVFLARAHDRADQLAGACTAAEPCDWPKVQALDSERRRDQVLGVSLLTAGGVMVAAGAGVLVWRWLSPAPGRVESVSFTPLPGGGVLAWSGTL